MRLSEAVNLFITKSGFENKTIQDYSYYLKDFVVFLTDKEVEQLTLKDVFDFELSLDSTPYTKYRYLATLKSFFKFLDFKLDLKPFDYYKIEAKCPPKNHYQPVSENDIFKLFKSFYKRNLHELRNLCICQTLFYTGCRSSEMFHLKIEDIDFDNCYVNIKKEYTKTKKDRTVFINKECCKNLRKYIERRNDNSPYLFVASGGKKVNPKTIISQMPKWGDRAGVANLHQHRFRHTHATILKDRGADIKDIQDDLGHASLKTTGQYLHTTVSGRKKVFDKCMGKNHRFTLTHSIGGTLEYEIEVFVKEQGNITKMQKVLKAAADELYG